MLSKHSITCWNILLLELSQILVGGEWCEKQYLIKYGNQSIISLLCSTQRDICSIERYINIIDSVTKIIISTHISGLLLLLLLFLHLHYFQASEGVV